MTSLTISPAPATPEMRKRPMTSLGALRALGWLCILASVAVLAFLYRDSIRWAIVAPLTAAIVIVAGFLLYLRGIEGNVPYFEIGAFYIALAGLYATYPI